jgi:hypothetical protein
MLRVHIELIYDLKKGFDIDESDLLSVRYLIVNLTMINWFSIIIVV